MGRFLREHSVILCLAAAAVVIILIRACLQSITIDEALSYLWFSSREYPFTQWFPHSANHVLNSLLMRLVTSIFGINELSVRTPALLGGIVYIASAVYLAVLLTGRKLVQWALFVCLVFNPVILDYLVAARGYGLAVGFLLTAIAVIANAVLSREPRYEAALRKRCIWVSALAGLSFSANFSFAIADAITVLFFFAWAVSARKKSGKFRFVRLGAACFVPGIVAAFLISGSVVADWPTGQLYFGSNSTREMLRRLADASFEPLNRDIVNPLLLNWLDPVVTALPWVVAFTIVFVLASNELTRLRRKCVPDEMLSFVRLVAGIAVATFLAHWIMFRTVRLLLPRDRTALFFVPLCTLALGAGVVVRSRYKGRDITRAWGTVVLVATSLYFVGCLRLGYFQEWIFDQDTKQLYWLANDLRNRCGISDFVVDWRYNVSMNFYREAYNNFSIPEYSQSVSDQLPVGKSAYVIYLPTSRDFIKQQKLQVIYHNDQSGSAVAIRGCPAQNQLTGNHDRK